MMAATARGEAEAEAEAGAEPEPKPHPKPGPGAWAGKLRKALQGGEEERSGGGGGGEADSGDLRRRGAETTVSRLGCDCNCSWGWGRGRGWIDADEEREPQAGAGGRSESCANARMGLELPLATRGDPGVRGDLGRDAGVAEREQSSWELGRDEVRLALLFDQLAGLCGESDAGDRRWLLVCVSIEAKL